ncbi:MAG: zinc-dependent metalloprotease family protein [Thermoanaerobaculia bacterium]
MSQTIRVPSALLQLVLGLSIALVPVQASAQPPDLFAHQDANKISSGLTPSEGTTEDRWELMSVRRSYAVIQPEVLDSILDTGTGTVRLNLFPDVDLIATLQGSNNAQLSLYEWTGSVDGLPSSTVYINQSTRDSGRRSTTGPRPTWGRILLNGESPESAPGYRIRSVGKGGLVAIEEIDFAALPIGSDDAPDYPMPPPQGTPLPGSESDLPLSGPSTTVINVLFLYTDAARLEAGVDMTQLAQESVVDANQILQRNQLDTEFRVAGVERIQIPDPANETSYVVSDEVRLLRGGFGGDTVHTFVGQADGMTSCGAAVQHNQERQNNYYEWAFSISSPLCLGASTFAHEIGHVLGACHATEDQHPCAGTPLRPYAFAYVDTVAHFATLMSNLSNPCSACARQKVYSTTNPLVLVNGQPAGDAQHNNAAMLEETDGQVAGYLGPPIYRELEIVIDGPGLVIGGDVLYCTATCSEFLNWGVRRSVRAIPSGATLFTGWDGFDCPFAGSMATTEEVYMDDDVRCEAHFSPVAGPILGLQKLGVGTGGVASEPTGIDCGTECPEQSASFSEGESVSLSATASTSSEFAGWSGDCAGSTPVAHVTMTGARNCSAAFDETGSAARLLIVSRIGNGAGLVYGQGIDCGADCTEAYLAGENVDLYAQAASDSVFAGWSGDCSGSGTHTSLVMNINRSCVAKFNISEKTLSVNKQGTGRGAVSSDPAGINCGFSCSQSSAEFALNQTVTLSANAEAGSRFDRWDLDCSGTDEETQVTISGDTICAAVFSPQIAESLTLNVALGIGEGTPEVAFSPGNGFCDDHCIISFAQNQIVTLEAIADGNREFSWWSGDCTGTSTTTTVYLDQDRHCTAVFRCPGTVPECTGGE